MLEVTGYLKFD